MRPLPILRLTCAYHIAPHFRDVIHYPQDITLKPFITKKERGMDPVLFTIGGNWSLGYQYCKTSHYSSHCCNSDRKHSEEEVLEVFSGEESHRNRNIETIHYSSSNHEVSKSHGHRSQYTSHSTSSNFGGHGGRSSLTSHSSYRNHRGYVHSGVSRS